MIQLMCIYISAMIPQILLSKKGEFVNETQKKNIFQKNSSQQSAQNISSSCGNAIHTGSSGLSGSFCYHLTCDVRLICLICIKIKQAGLLMSYINDITSLAIK